MDKRFDINEFLTKSPFVKEEIEKEKIDTEELERIYQDYMTYRENYENQADFIANILRTNDAIHSVKSRIKVPERLIEKIIRKTGERKEKYGPDFKFSTDNYKNEINDLIGIRALHIFKQEWEVIHKFILDTWKVIEITANVREGDDTKIFEDLGIEIISRQSGYRSVHYLIEFYPTSQRVIAEIQVRTIFEEGYGEIDHKLRYSHKKIPALLASNLLLFNRIVGSADEMASLINQLSRDLEETEVKYEKLIAEKDEEIRKLKENFRG